MATPYPNLDEELRKSTDAQRSFNASNTGIPSGAPSAERVMPHTMRPPAAPLTAQELVNRNNMVPGPASVAGTDNAVPADVVGRLNQINRVPPPPTGPAPNPQLDWVQRNNRFFGPLTPVNTTAAGTGNAVPANIIRQLDQSNRAPPVVSGPALTTRPPTSMTPHQIESYMPGAAKGAGVSVSIPQATIDQMGQQPLPPVERAAQNMNPNDPFGGLGERAYRAGLQAQLDQYAAREREGQLFKMQAMQNHLAEVQARTNKEKADEDLRFANFAAKNGADMVLRGGLKSQKKAILADQANAAGAAAVAKDAHLKALGAFPTAGADPVKNAILSGELGNRRAQTEQEGLKTLAGLGVASAKMRGEQAQAGAEAEKLKQAKSFSAISSILSDPKSSSKDKSEAQKSLLAMLGKNQTAGRMIPFRFNAEVDKFGNPVGEPEDAFMFLGEDGSREVLRASDLVKQKEKK